MYTKTLVALAVAALVGDAIASPHRHGLQHPHDKRALVTELVTVTDWVTVTVTDGETTASPKAFYSHSHKSKVQSSSESSSSESTTTSSPPAPVVPTTIVTQVTSTSAAPEQNSPPVVEAVPSPSTTSEVVVVNTPTPTPPAPSSTTQAASSPVEDGSGTSGNSDTVDTGNNASADTGASAGTGGSAKRGLAYNNPDLLKSFLSSGTKVSWTYNWGQYDDSGTDLEFCPMLWGLKLDFASTWPANAQKAIDAGSKCLFSFNEPDLGSQSNLSPQVAAEKHIELMNPFSGKARIGAPAITNGGGSSMGIGWMQQFFDACGGKCAVDFINIHVYGVDTNTFLTHLRNVYAAFNKPVWISEFAFDGSDAEINSQLETVIDQIETNATYSFVERYSYFMVQDGTMLKGNSLSTYGNTFAYGA